MTRLPLPATLLAALCACGSSGYTADGGHARVDCQNTFTVIPVRALDVSGMPVSDATVTATNQSNGKSLTGTTNGDGKTAAITEEICNGQVSITATSGALKTAQGFIVEVVCGECDCTAMPGTVTVTLE